MEKINEKMEELFKTLERFHEVDPDIFKPSFLDINGNSIEITSSNGYCDLKIKVFKTEVSDIKDGYLIYINDEKTSYECVTEEVVLKRINGMIDILIVKFEEYKLNLRNKKCYLKYLKF